MKLPTKFTIAGQTWTVKVVNPQDIGGDYGDCSRTLRRIRISEELSARERYETFLHELEHVYLYTDGHLSGHDEAQVERRAQYRLQFEESKS